MNEKDNMYYLWYNMVKHSPISLNIMPLNVDLAKSSGQATLFVV
jgi:hypothetical protein